ncbi:Manganese ABC transporter, periplasmic-binding protein SitA [Candidatus Sumerlaea chitinivorans]|uniref:Manganese ABC transporter, periplasmic-binding protein SitA n=1 Tax=Sumerlaea chitinivorans TaxID=2250252 RepID=A0A2Z4Y222_SUMC1|nr:Manganese ABC transporter, periplasmic-binding protein SitA [Candidatus Sumerlaea chitinivorans]
MRKDLQHSLLVLQDLHLLKTSHQMPRQLVHRYLKFCLAIGLVFLAGCAPPRADRTPGQPLRVIATTSIITDTVRQVGGDRIQLRGLMGPGVDPHLYKASEGDVQRLAEADIVFYNGLHLEAKLTDVFVKMGRHVRAVPVTRDIPRERLIYPSDAEEAPDPHVWFDVQLWKFAVQTIRDVLCEADPESSAVFAQNASRYLDELEVLDSWVRREMQAIPNEQRVLITAHDAFNYFGRAYDIEVRGLQGISTVAEAGTADVEQLARLIAQRRIRAIFVETSVPVRTIQAMRQTVRALGWNVEIGGELFSDALGSPDTPAASYVGMVRYNVETIVRALKP